MWLHDSECGSILRHRTDPKIGMSPHHRVADHRIHVIDDPDQTFRRDDGTELQHACARAGAQRNAELIAYAAAMQRLRGDEAPLEPAAESKDLAQARVLGFEGLYTHLAQCDRIALRHHGVVHRECAPALFGALLQPEQGSKYSAPEPARDRFAHLCRKDERDQRENRTDEQYGTIDPVVRASEARHPLPQGERTDQYFSSSSRIRPVPRTTHVSGSSST